MLKSEMNFYNYPGQLHKDPPWYWNEFQEEDEKDDFGQDIYF